MGKNKTKPLGLTDLNNYEKTREKTNLLEIDKPLKSFIKGGERAGAKNDFLTLLKKAVSA